MATQFRKPRKIVLKSDSGEKRFSTEVFNLVRTRLAPTVGGDVNRAVKLAAEHFAPRLLAEVTAVEMGDAIPQIAAELSKSSQNTSNGGRLPLDGEAQKNWDPPVSRWRGKLTIHGIRQRFAAELKDGIELSTSLLDTYADELTVEKARVAELVKEHDDPDSKPVTCGSPVHQGTSEFQPTIRFRLYRNDAGELARRKHDQGEDFILIGNFLVVPNEDGSDGTRVPYCPDCREAAWEYGREHEEMVTFYTAAGAQRKLGKMKDKVERNTAFAAQLKSAGARTFGGGYGTRKLKDWRQSRGRRR